MNASSLTEMKGAIRSHVADKLKALPELFIHQASNAIFENLKSLPSFTNSNGVSIYLNMQAEVLTGTVLEYSLQQNKAVFIPKVIGKNSPDMVMYELSNGLQEIEKFPRNRWGIPEPSVESAKSRPDGTYSGKIDCVIMPGVAFDKNRGRVGHGKGYYDCFLEKLEKHRASLGLHPPIKIALALDEQIIDSVPMENHDKYLDFIVTPTTIYSA